MADHTLQQQFEAFMALYYEDRAQDRAERDSNKQDLLNQLHDVVKGITTSTSETSSATPRIGKAKALTEDERPLLVHHLPKLDFPRFRGDTDPLTWLNHCNHYFRHQHTPELENLQLVAIHLEDDAQLWFIKLSKDSPNLSWEAFKSKCHLRFGPTTHGNQLGALAKLQQTGSVDDYQWKFEQLSARASSLTSEQEVELFLSGLKEYIAVEVELHHPKDLTSAMSLARL